MRVTDRPQRADNELKEHDKQAQRFVERALTLSDNNPVTQHEKRNTEAEWRDRLRGELEREGQTGGGLPLAWTGMELR